MGCVGSKNDDSPAVALCRQRCAYLDEAIHQRYALAEAHLAYFHSLKSVGFSLHNFFESSLDSSAAGDGGDGPPSPVLNLPNRRKTDPAPSPPPRAVANGRNHHSRSHSGSHLHFHSDTDSDGESLHLHSDDDEDSLHDHHHHHHHHHDHHNNHKSHDNPVYGGDRVYGNEVYGGGQFGYADREFEPPAYQPYQPPGGGYMMGTSYNMNFMRNRATPSVVYEQRPASPETVRFGEASSSGSYYNGGGGYPNQNSGGGNYGGYSGFGGWFGSNSQPSSSSSYLPAAAAADPDSKPPPPPPSPPRGSAWDFLNPFETFEKYYPPYTPSRDSKEVREEEGIPDLEDEEYYYQNEVVKEVDVNQKFVDKGGGGGGGSGGGERRKYSKSPIIDDKESEEEDEEEEVISKGKGKGVDRESHYRTRPSIEDDAVEYEVHVVDKKVVDNEERLPPPPPVDRGNVAAFKAQPVFRNDSEVVKEIQIQFERASESGNELAKMLEVGKVPHNRKHAAYQVSTKMLKVISPSLSVPSSQASTSKSVDSSSIDMADTATLDSDEVVDTRSSNLSSTLHKLYLWEKKLYEEVKIEEKMRILHEQKNQKLKRLDEKGAEAHKVDATRTLVRSLSTKIRIAIQVVDKISVKINNLRDDELWPQLDAFIHGLTRMWRSMLECHHGQCQAIGAARRLDAVTSRKHFSDASLEATLQLEHELLNWTLRFSCWFGAQKGYVQALNNWLLKCLLYVPEETPDGPVPFSPSRIGAPPVFVICNQWAQALDRISDKEVIDSMRDFAATVLRLWDRDKTHMRQRMMSNKDMERKVKNLEREDQKIHKEIQVLDKRIVHSHGDGLALAGQAVYQSETTKTGSVQISLQRIFEAMERFTASSLTAYEELLQRIEEDRRSRSQANVS